MRLLQRRGFWEASCIENCRLRVGWHSKRSLLEAVSCAGVAAFSQELGGGAPIQNRFVVYWLRGTWRRRAPIFSEPNLTFFSISLYGGHWA